MVVIPSFWNLTLFPEKLEENGEISSCKPVEKENIWKISQGLFKIMLFNYTFI